MAKIFLAKRQYCIYYVAPATKHLILGMWNSYLVSRAIICWFSHQVLSCAQCRWVLLGHMWKQTREPHFQRGIELLYICNSYMCLHLSASRHCCLQKSPSAQQCMLYLISFSDYLCDHFFTVWMCIYHIATIAMACKMCYTDIYLTEDWKVVHMPQVSSRVKFIPHYITLFQLINSGV